MGKGYAKELENRLNDEAGASGLGKW